MRRNKRVAVASYYYILLFVESQKIENENVKMKGVKVK